MLPRSRSRQTLLTLLASGTLALALVGGSGLGMAATQPPVAPALLAPPGTELWHIDTSNSRFVAAGGGQTHLYLYGGPVGMPDETGWHFRDPSLVSNPSDGSLSPARLPFSLRIGAGATAGQAAVLQS